MGRSKLNTQVPRLESSSLDFFKQGQRLLPTVQLGYVSSYSRGVFDRFGFQDPSANVYDKLLSLSNIVNGYTSVIVELDELTVELDLKEFAGQF